MFDTGDICLLIQVGYTHHLVTVVGENCNGALTDITAGRQCFTLTVELFIGDMPSVNLIELVEAEYGGTIHHLADNWYKLVRHD